MDATNTSKSLSGAEFELYSDAACTQSVGTLSETQTGIYSLSLENLTAEKTYYLKETKAPAGYQIADTVYRVSFDEKGKVTLKDQNGQDVQAVGDRKSVV